MAFQFTVPDMACSACGDKITNAIKAIDPAATIQADPKTKLVSVDSGAEQAAIAQAITSAGYTVS